MKYDDLLGVPYRVKGRDKKGFDCYGLVLECCKRAGTPLIDLNKAVKTLPSNQVNDYIRKGLNVKKIEKPKKGCIVETIYNNNVHLGYMVDRDKVLHSTFEKGVQITSPLFLKVIAFYEVVNESCNI